jgi:hypothetical protein
MKFLSAVERWLSGRAMRPNSRLIGPQPDALKSALRSPLAQLELLRGAPVILYAGMINSDTVQILYDCLRHTGASERLHLVLSTAGGSVTAARQIALLLREFTARLTILVPYRAWSAGTLLCLSANELILGPLAELGPIDPHISSAGPPPEGAPAMISAEDIRAFRQMAEGWFGVQREEDRLQVLALVAQHIFPTSLSAFYRSHQLTRQIATELLCYQMPDAEPGRRQQVVDQLIEGYYAHNYAISRAEARALGLQVHYTSSDEESLLWQIIKVVRQHAGDESLPPEGSQRVHALIMSTGFYARQMERIVNRAGGTGGAKRGGEEEAHFSDTRLHWEIEER